MADDAAGLGPIHLAVLRGDVAALRELLAAKAKTNVKTTAMVASIEGRDTRVHRPASATFYLPDPHPAIGPGRAFDKGSQPLHLAASIGDIEAVELLLSAKARASAKDGCGATPLHLAALGGHAQVVERLLEHKLDVNAPTKVRKSLRFFDIGMTPLHAALEGGNSRIVDLLLDAGADPAARTKHGCGSVFFAARGGSVDALEQLVTAGASAAEPPAYDNFPLLEAVENNHPQMVKRLIELGAPTQHGRNQAPLRRATELRFLEVRQALLDGGAAPLPDHGVGHAAQGNDVEAVAAYIDGGGDPNVIERGTTPMMVAAAHGRTAVVELLLQRGADPNINPGTGTALHYALGNQQHGIVALLLAAGADCGQVDEHGNQPLWAAISQKAPNHLGRIETMLKLGADPHRRNRHGTSVFETVEEQASGPGSEVWGPILELLKTAGGSPQPKVEWQDPAQSQVLADATGDYSWKKLHAALWDELVPPSHEAGTVQGELIRCIGNLCDEAYRNGNINWGDRHRRMVDFINTTLLGDDTFDPNRQKQIGADLRRLGSRSPDVSGDGSPHYNVNEAVVDWCVAHPQLTRR